MTLTRAFWPAAVGLLALVLGLPASARATTITCPEAAYQYGNKSQHTSNTYSVDPAIDCVWSPQGSKNIGSATDDFLLGLGQNDPAYGTGGGTFGLAWSFVDGTGGTSASNLASIGGLTITNFAGSSASWSIDPAALNLAYGTSFNAFALGVKDGSEPHWAVFLLDPLRLSGTVSMTGGSFSHLVVYGAVRNISEPSALVLLGCGFFAVARSLKGRRRGRA